MKSSIIHHYVDVMTSHRPKATGSVDHLNLWSHEPKQTFFLIILGICHSSRKETNTMVQESCTDGTKTKQEAYKLDDDFFKLNGFRYIWSSISYETDY